MFPVLPSRHEGLQSSGAVRKTEEYDVKVCAVTTSNLIVIIIFLSFFLSSLLSLSLLVVQVIEMVKDHILPYASKLPQQFLEQLTMVLNRGSIHSATDSVDGEQSECMHA